MSNRFVILQILRTQHSINISENIYETISDYAHENPPYVLAIKLLSKYKDIYIKNLHQGELPSYGKAWMMYSYESEKQNLKEFSHYYFQKIINDNTTLATISFEESYSYPILEQIRQLHSQKLKIEIKKNPPTKKSCIIL